MKERRVREEVGQTKGGLLFRHLGTAPILPTAAERTQSPSPCGADNPEREEVPFGTLTKGRGCLELLGNLFPGWFPGKAEVLQGSHFECFSDGPLHGLCLL